MISISAVPTTSPSPTDIHLGVAIVGTGFGQKVHIPAFQAHHQTQIVAVYNRDLAKAKAIAQAHEIPHATHDLAQLIALPDVNGISISTPPFLHYEMAQAALKADKHLFLEKPTTLTAAEAKALYHLAQERGLQATLNFEFRYVPAWLHLKALLSQEVVGSLRLIKIDWLVPGRADPNRAWSWHGSKTLGGGSLGALASHTFDYIAWLFGPIRRLCARLITTIPERPDPKTGAPKPVDADDTCTLMLELTNGTICQVTISATTYAGRGHWVEVYGDRGTLMLGSNNPQDYIHGFQLWYSQLGSSLELVPIPPELAFKHTYEDGRIAPTLRVVDHWVQMIQQEQTTAPSLREGVYSQLLMDSAHHSDQSGAWVDVPDLDHFLMG